MNYKAKHIDTTPKSIHLRQKQWKTSSKDPMGAIVQTADSTPINKLEYLQVKNEQMSANGPFQATQNSNFKQLISFSSSIKPAST